MVSFIPSFFLVGFTYVLIETGAWGGHGPLEWARAGNSLTHFGNLAILTLVSIVLGIAVHPVQFALVQFFEGYWGSGRLAQRLRAWKIIQHGRRFDRFDRGRGDEAGAKLHDAVQQREVLSAETKVKLLSWHDEDRRLLGGYPYEKDDILPTRFGNVLRRYERLAGSQYNLDAVTVIRHVAFVAPARHMDYLNDQRRLLDLSVRMCATSVVAAFVAVAFLWSHGAWLAVSLVPYGIAYLSYRGAVVVAHEYGAAICAVIDVDRFALYDYLRMPRPENTRAERRANAQLMKLLRHNPKADLPYDHSQAPSGSSDAAKPS